MMCHMEERRRNAACADKMFLSVLDDVCMKGEDHQ